MYRYKLQPPKPINDRTAVDGPKQVRDNSYDRETYCIIVIVPK